MSICCLPAFARVQFSIPTVAVTKIFYLSRIKRKGIV